VATALRDVARLLDRLGCAPALVEDGTIVLAEVLNNVEEHAYAGRRGEPVMVDLRIGATRLSCRVEDFGLPLPDGPLPGADMPRGNPVEPDTLPEGGFGWAMVRRLTSDLVYLREDGCNRLSFTIGARGGQRF
jgi:serine/threonine-protein kinase RsbW